MSMDLKSRFEARPSGIRPPIIMGSAYTPSGDASRGFIRWAIFASVLFHIVLFAVDFPSSGRLAAQPEPVAQRAIYVLRQARFSPPKPAIARPLVSKRRKRLMPIPDPTPDDPEPIVDRFQVSAPEVPVDEIGEFLDGLVIPEAPPNLGGGSGPPVWPGEGITPPSKIFAPSPEFTEGARRARVQGVVILSGIVDVYGNVTHLRVLKGLPLGLSESALGAVSAWTFEPAMRGDEPVAVFFNFTINFSLQ